MRIAEVGKRKYKHQSIIMYVEVTYIKHEKFRIHICMYKEQPYEMLYLSYVQYSGLRLW